MEVVDCIVKLTYCAAGYYSATFELDFDPVKTAGVPLLLDL